MKKIRLPLLLSFLISYSLTFGQTTIYEEDFEIGSGWQQDWFLNSTDEGSVDNTNAEWAVVSAYTGGQVSIQTPFPFPHIDTIPDVPDQPIEVTNSPNSNYLCMRDGIALSQNVTCASYLRSDDNNVNIPSKGESRFVRTGFVNTSGYENITISFYWLGGVSPSNGGLYYTTDNSATWQLLQDGFGDQLDWTLATIPASVLDDQTSLIRFGFKYEIDGFTSGNYMDVENGFSIDEFKVEGDPVGSANLNENSTSLIQLYPNPTSNSLKIQSELPIEQIIVSNLSGQRIMNTSDNIVDVSNFNTGVYLITVATVQGSFTRRFVKR